LGFGFGFGFGLGWRDIFLDVFFQEFLFVGHSIL
jgi:hypothetical protein